MTDIIERTSLWQNTLAKQPQDQHEISRDKLRNALLHMRANVTHLVDQIRNDIPGLTVHNISHLDALWTVADVIAGPDFRLTPVEAFVFGCAVLLHDTGMAIGSYPGGLKDIKDTIEWRDVEASIRANEPTGDGAAIEAQALFSPASVPSFPRHLRNSLT